MLSRSGAFGGALHRQRANHPIPGYPSLVVRSGGRLSHPHLFRSREVRRPEVERHVVDLAVEAKWYLVVLIVYPGAGVEPDVEGLVRRQQERDRLWDLQRTDLVAVDLEHSGAALCDARAVIPKVEHDRVLACGE